MLKKYKPVTLNFTKVFVLTTLDCKNPRLKLLLTKIAQIEQ